jgi:hypothetical protein
MDLWPVVVVVVGFGLATALVIVLARSSTVRWERQRTAARRRSIRREVRGHGRALRDAEGGEPQPEVVPRRRRLSAVPKRRSRRAPGSGTRRRGGTRVSGGS